MLQGGALALALAPAAALSNPYAIAQAETISAEITQLFVHPLQGSDRSTGTEDAPLQTLTRALAIASPGTTIVLAPGRYSRDSGEQFPLHISDGVTVQGSPDDYGDGVIIQGGSAFVSDTAGRQNAAAIASDGAVLSGVTLSNEDGHGLWVEQGAPTVTNCLFWGSRQAGIVVSGSSSPTIHRSRFYQNRGSGLTILGTATPLIETNRVEDTGYGVTIGEQAAPRLLQNYISGNRSGLIVQNQARPVLRDNHILRNRQDGVVTIAQAQPDLGTQAQPGGNQFEGNGQYDINAQASQQIIAAAGNRFSAIAPSGQTSGRIDFNGLVAIASPTAAPQPLAAPRAAPAQRQPTSALSAPLPVRPVAYRSAGERPAVATADRTTPLQAALPVRPQRPAQRNANLLPVPTANVPVGHVGGLSTVSAASGVSSGGRSQLRYRVVVVASSAQAQALVQAIAPGAFITRVNGRAVMQAGAYQSAENAGAMQRRLVSSGLRAEVQQMR